jgi:hypothetical protein
MRRLNVVNGLGYVLEKQSLTNDKIRKLVMEKTL